MAIFSGPGSFTLAGVEMKLHDIQFLNDAGVSVGSGEVRGCYFGQANGTSQIALLKTSSGTLRIIENVFAQEGIAISADTGVGDRLTVADNLFFNGEQALVTVGTLNQQIAFTGNTLFSMDDWMVELVGVLGANVSGNEVLDANGGFLTDDANSRDVLIAANVIEGYTDQAAVHVFSDDTTITGNHIRGSASGSAAAIIAEDADAVTIKGNALIEPDGHGILADTCTNSHVADNLISQPGTAQDNTYDGIQIVAGSNVSVIANKIQPSLFGFADTRYGINIASGNDHQVYANSLGDSSEYGTADSVDAGTNTQVAPAGGVIGGQFAW